MVRSQGHHVHPLIEGSFFLLVGLLFLSNWRWMWGVAHLALIFGLVYIAVKGILQLLQHAAQDPLWLSLTKVLGVLALAGLAVVRRELFLTLVCRIVGCWALFNGFAQAISFLVCWRDRLSGALGHALLTIANSAAGLACLLIPRKMFRLLSWVVAGYLIYYGTIRLGNGLMDWLTPQARHPLLQHLNIAVPILLSVWIPYWLFFSSKILEKDRSSTVLPPDAPDLEVLIYLRPSGPEALGHVDIGFRGKIYSYGCHDPLNRFLMGTLGDGVMIVSDRQAFLTHALLYEHKTIVSYGLSLTDQQLAVVERRIEQMLQRAVPWQSAAEQGDTEAGDYASRVWRDTHAKMMKFSEGEFRTYFVFSTNCVLLVDHILRSPQLDLFNFSGIVTPGTYLTFLNNEYCRDSSMVISRKCFKKEDAIQDGNPVLSGEESL